MEITTELHLLTTEQACALLKAMREEVAEAKSYCERYKREKEEREGAASTDAVA